MKVRRETAPAAQVILVTPKSGFCVAPTFTPAAAARFCYKQISGLVDGEWLEVELDGLAFSGSQLWVWVQTDSVRIGEPCVGVGWQSTSRGDRACATATTASTPTTATAATAPATAQAPRGGRGAQDSSAAGPLHEPSEAPTSSAHGRCLACEPLGGR